VLSRQMPKSVRSRARARGDSDGVVDFWIVVTMHLLFPILSHRCPTPLIFLFPDLSPRGRFELSQEEDRCLMGSMSIYASPQSHAYGVYAEYDTSEIS